CPADLAQRVGGLQLPEQLLLVYVTRHPLRQTGRQAHARLEDLVLDDGESDPLELPSHLAGAVVERQAGVALELVLRLVEYVAEVLEAFVLAIETQPQLEVIDIERQRLPFACIAGRVQHLEKAHRVETLETQ